MSQASAISRNYARALFAVAQEGKIIDKIADNLESFKAKFSEEFARELQNPVISKNDLVGIMEEINKEFSFEDAFSNFLLTLASNKRISLFLDIYAEFILLLKNHKNILDVEVIFANKLEKAQLDKIKAVIEKQHSGKTIEIKETLNPKILGGFQVKIGSSIVDASLKNQIFSLKQELTTRN